MVDISIYLPRIYVTMKAVVQMMASLWRTLFEPREMMMMTTTTNQSLTTRERARKAMTRTTMKQMRETMMSAKEVAPKDKMMMMNLTRETRTMMRQ